MRIFVFAKRCGKEILRDPLNLAFGLGFPIVLLLLLTAIQANVPVDLFQIQTLAPGVSVFGLSFITLFSATLIAKDRVLLINPKAVCITEDVFLDKQNVPLLLEKYKPDYVADAIDYVEAKIALAKHCEILGIPIIASMGTGNKLDPTAFECTDIYKTTMCPLAKSMRKRLKDSGVSHLKVVYSKEPVKASGAVVNSVSFVPSTAGMVIAGEIIKELCGINIQPK